MVSIEKLSLFNIDVFRNLYDKTKNSYNYEENFFDFYDDKSFIIKYMLRKQVILFKAKNKYIGYVWYEYPAEDGLSNIYSFKIEDEYINDINSNLLKSIKSKYIRFDIIDNLKINTIMKNLQFKPMCQAILMKIKISELNFKKEDYTVRHFKKNQDEKLRCDIQNSVFDDKNRIPLTVGDVKIEEEEDYYIEDFAVFICNVENEPVGYGQVIYSKGVYTIVNLGILESYRGQGYGEMLVNCLVNLCRKKGIEDVHIKVEAKNSKAISLYRKIGFKEYDSLTTWSKIN